MIESISDKLDSDTDPINVHYSYYGASLSEPHMHTYARSNNYLDVINIINRDEELE